MNEWTPRRCSPEYFESRAKEMADLRKPQPWACNQGRGPYLQWNESIQASEPVAPMTWKDEAFKYGIAGLVLSWAAFLGWVLYQIGKAVAK